MKTITTTFAIWLLLLLPIARGMEVSIDINRFHADKNDYIEIYYRILGGSISFQQTEGNQMEAYVGVKLAIKSGNQLPNESMVSLYSGKVDTVSDIIHIQRIKVVEGIYECRLQFTDQQDTTNRFEASFVIDINARNQKSISDIKILSNMVKDEQHPLATYGYIMEPFVYNIVNLRQQIVKVYAELYDQAPTANGYAYYSIGIYPGVAYGDTLSAIMLKNGRAKANNIMPIFESFDTNKLPSGQYMMVVKWYDAHKMPISHSYKTFINQNFPADLYQERMYNKEVKHSFLADIDSATVRYHLLALLPTLPSVEVALVQDLIQNRISYEQKYYLLKHYTRLYGSQAAIGFNKFHEVAKKVDDLYYNTNGRGFQTDRGHMFLKYGKPNNVILVEDEANTPPYEIWYYNYLEATKQTNVRFIFYNPSLVANDFYLLHSTCYGERKNPAWEVELYKNATGETVGDRFEATKMKDNWYRRARKLFDYY